LVKPNFNHHFLCRRAEHAIYINISQNYLKLVLDVFKVKRRKLFFSSIAFIVCAVLIGSTVTALTFLSSPKATVDQQCSLPEGCISADEAIQIATPYINQYANENNRTIIDVKATFNFVPDFACERSDNSSALYPIWGVEASFEKITYNSWPPSGNYYFIGYSVTIWADTAQIQSHGVQGFF
jgi:hypothetical protein